MLEKVKSLGPRALVVPFLAATLMACVFGGAMLPILLMDATDVNFGVVSLDEGATTFLGNSNLGDTVVENITSGDGLSVSGSSDSSEEAADSSSSVSSINWQVYESQEKLMDAIDKGDVYGGLVIPKNFTAQQMLNATGLGNAPVMKVYLNQARNPMMVTMMQPTLINMMNKNGMCVDVEVLNEVDLGGHNSMSYTIGLTALAMPVYIMSLMGGILGSLLLWARGGTRRQKAVSMVKQLVYAAVFSLFAGCVACSIDLIGGLNLPMERLVPFMWLASAAMLLPIMACANIKIPLAALLAITFMGLGQGTVMYSADMLPAFWANYVAPWVPQASIGTGLRSILYMGGGSFDAGTTALIGWIIAAGVLLLLGVLKPEKPLKAAPAAEDGSAASVLALPGEALAEGDASKSLENPKGRARLLAGRKKHAAFSPEDDWEE